MHFDCGYFANVLFRFQRKKAKCHPGCLPKGVQQPEISKSGSELLKTVVVDAKSLLPGDGTDEKQLAVKTAENTVKNSEKRPKSCKETKEKMAEHKKKASKNCYRNIVMKTILHET